MSKSFNMNDSDDSWYSCVDQTSSFSGNASGFSPGPPRVSSTMSSVTMNRNLEMQLNSEALEALENCLMQQVEKAMIKKRNDRQLLENQLGFHNDTKDNIMNKTERILNKSSILNEDIKSIIVERDEAMQELRNVEQSFSDVFRKYEKAKIVLENLKKNQAFLKQRDEELQLQLAARDQKLEAFKQESQQIIERMYGDFTGKIANVEKDSARLQAQLRRSEMRVETLNAELLQKRRENDQLNLLADELIGKTPR